jgi:hypothetical protein
MTVLADFNTIIADDPESVGASHEKSVIGKRFNTGGVLGKGSGQTGDRAAFIMFSVLNLTEFLDVFVNDQGPIGTMEPNRGVPGWSSQVICMSGGRLKDGDGDNNEISVTLRPENLVGSTEFMIKNLICFYHQDSD